MEQCYFNFNKVNKGKNCKESIALMKKTLNAMKAMDNETIYITGRCKDTVFGWINRVALKKNIIFRVSSVGNFEHFIEKEIKVKKTKSKNMRYISTKTRFEVLHRDNFKCVYCGVKGESSNGLHIDHYIPVSKGGTNDINNLRTSCPPCNLGKSNKLIN